jgi:hypothetical protein
MIENDLKVMGLRKRHIAIINLFLSQPGKGLSAQEVASGLKMPLTRTYTFLNQLHAQGLLDKSDGARALFSMSDVETKFRRFLFLKGLEQHAVEKEIIDYVAQLSAKAHRDAVVPLRSSDEFYQALYQLVQKTTVLKMFTRTNMLVLPSPKKHYWREQVIDEIRSKVRQHMQMTYLMDARTVKGKRLSATAEKNLSWLRGNGVEIKSINAPDMVSMVIGDNEAIIGFRYPRENITGKGLLINVRDLLNFFNAVFDDAVSHGVPA